MSPLPVLLTSTPVPLYQEYLLNSVKAGLQSVLQTGLSDLVGSQCLPGLQSQPSSPRFAVASPASPCVLQDKTVCSLWQELPVVKEQGLLEVLTAREVRQQEVSRHLLAGRRGGETVRNMADEIIHVSG